MTRTSTKSTHIFSGHFILFGTYTVRSSIGEGVGLKPNYPFGVISWEIPSAPSIWGKNSERSEATFHMGKVLSRERGGVHKFVEIITFDLPLRVRRLATP